MQPRPKVWIPIIVGIFVVSMLVGFAPVRWERDVGFQVESTFTFEVSDPLFETPAEIPDLEEELSEMLIAAGLRDADVEIREDSVLRVETFAIDQEQANRDRALVERALGEHFDEAQLTFVVTDTQVEEPVATFGPFGIYRPIPQLRLGLDLQGGAHVVLRCLPDAELNFLLGDDTPLVTEATARIEDTEFVPPFTTEQLKLRIASLLQQTGADPGEVEVSVVGTSRLIVNTRPEDRQQVTRQQEAIHNFLVENYPGVEVERGEISAVFVDDDTADRVLYIVEQRLFRMGEIREPIIQKQGYDRIIVEMPGVRDPERVIDILQSTALLEFRLVPERYEPVSALTYHEWTDHETNMTVSWEEVRAESTVEFTGRDLLPNAQVQAGQAMDWVVAFELRHDKKDAFHEFTRRNIDRIMAIVLDREAKMAPTIRSAIPGRGIIEGNMTTQEASDLRLLLNAGALPVPLEIVENRTVSATLGQASVIRSLEAAGLGVLALMIFMVAYYRLPGLLANIALFLYLGLVLAITSYAEVTVTLPGIAGIILSLGTAVDANVIIFERLKEELYSRKSMRAAVASGFDRAWTAILDANVTTLLATAVLYWLGTSLIKGFAIMLFIGVICSLFTAVTVTRWLLTMTAELPWAQKRSLYGVPEHPAEEQQEGTQPA